MKKKIRCPDTASHMKDTFLEWIQLKGQEKYCRWLISVPRHYLWQLRYPDGTCPVTELQLTRKSLKMRRPYGWFYAFFDIRTVSGMGWLVSTAARFCFQVAFVSRMCYGRNDTCACLHGPVPLLHPQKCSEIAETSIYRTQRSRTYLIILSALLLLWQREQHFNNISLGQMAGPW